MKQELRSYKIYRFGGNDLTITINHNNEVSEAYIGHITEEDLKAREILLKDSFLYRTYLKYFKLEHKEKQLIDDFIVVELPQNARKKKSYALGILQSGIWGLNAANTYEYFLTTPNLLKHEDDVSKGAVLMYKDTKEMRAFKTFYENLISLNAIKDYKDKLKSINTEHARIALSMSSAKLTNLKSKYIIVDECKYNITSDIVTVIDKKVVEITENTEDEELEKYRNVAVTQFDGCGIMSKEFAQQIKEDCKYKHNISWAGIRMYGIAVKGLIVSIDFKEYLHQFYTQDTDYIRKIKDGKIEILDIYGKWRCIDDADMILNSSQCKWAEHFSSMEEIQEKIDLFPEYKDLIENLWICKVNKPVLEIEKYNLSNYQLLGNLKLTLKDMEQLTKPTEDYFNNILDKENEDSFFLYLKLLNIHKKKSEEDDAFTETEVEKIDINTVAEQLLVKNPRFVKCDYVRRAITKTLKKQLNLLCAGETYIESYYKTVTQDPISFLDWLINRTKKDEFIDSTKGLKAHQFYCSDIEDGEIRTCSRNPLASYSEIMNLTYAKNPWLDRWYGHLSKDLMICNCYDLTKETASGMDFDMDCINVVNNELIKSAVKTDKPFINIADINKEKPKMKWNDTNRYIAIAKSIGNVIGKIANITTSVSAKATTLDYYVYQSKKSNNIYTYEEVKDCFKKAYPQEIKTQWHCKTLGKDMTNDKDEPIIEGSKEHFRKALEINFNKIYNPELTEEKVKELIDKQFEDLKSDSYFLRNLSMAAIDVPKTLIPVTPEDYKSEKETYKYNPYFIGYRKGFYDESGRRKFFKFSQNALNLNATRIREDIIVIQKLESKINNTSTSKNLIQAFLYNPCEKENPQWEDCSKDIIELYDLYNNNRNNIKNKYADLIEKMENAEGKKRLTEERDIQYRLHDVNILSHANAISAKYNNFKLISSILSQYTSEIFMFNYFNKDTMKMLDETSVLVPKYEYIEDPEGDIEFKFKKYRKEVVEINTNDTTMQENIRQRYCNKKKIELEDTKVNIGYLLINKNNIKDYLNKELIIDKREYNGEIQPALVDENGNHLCFIFKNKDLLNYMLEKVKIKEIIKPNNKSAVIMIGV